MGPLGEFSRIQWLRRIDTRQVRTWVQRIIPASLILARPLRCAASLGLALAEGFFFFPVFDLGVAVKDRQLFEPDLPQVTDLPRIGVAEPTPGSLSSSWRILS